MENHAMPGQLIKLALAVLLLSAVAYLGYNKYQLTHPQAPAGMMGMGGPMAVDAAEVREQEITLWHEFSGRLEAVDAAEIRPRVSGPIQSINFKNGAQVGKDDLLFIIDQGPYKAEVDRLQGTMVSARAQAELARTEFDRADGLFKTQAISQREFDQRTNDLNVAEANLKSAEAALEAAKLNLDYTEVRAPIAGRVGRAEVTVGNMVQAGPNAPMLTMIASETPIYADFEMDEATYLRYAQAAAGGHVQVPVKLGLLTEKDTPHEGRIESFDNRLDAASGTIRVRALFQNPDGLLVPGLFARIRIADVSASRVLLINDRAVGTDQDKKFVLAIGDDNVTQYRQVKLGPPVEGLRIVEDGLKAGDKIVISGLSFFMRPGLPVAPNMVAMDAPPGPPPGAEPPQQKPEDKAPGKAEKK